MKRSLPGQFFYDQLGVSCIDIASAPEISSPPPVYAVGGAARTLGSYILTAPTLQGPTQNEKWSLISVSMQAQVGFCPIRASSITANITSVCFGKLGKIKAFLLPGDASRGATPTDGVVGGFGNYGASCPAYDETLAASLWDPADDNMPPLQALTYPTGQTDVPASVLSGLLPAGASIQLPEPVELVPGQPPLIGIQMTPSIIGFTTPNPNGYLQNAGLILGQINYVINYDDGR